MEIKFSEALPLEKAIRGGIPGVSYAPGGNTSITVVPKRDVPPPAPSADEEEEPSPLSDETISELVRRSAELLSMFDRELKYEVMEDAGVVQIQVIDTRDGRVVRKIPADEVIKLLEQMKDQIDDRIDVLA